MDWTQIITTVTPIILFLGWVYLRIDKRFDYMDGQIREMRKDIQGLDSRVSRIEGQLTGMYWEPKVKPKKAQNDQQ